MHVFKSSPVYRPRKIYTPILSFSLFRSAGHHLSESPREKKKRKKSITYLNDRQGLGLVELGELHRRRAPRDCVVPRVHHPETPLGAPAHCLVWKKGAEGGGFMCSFVCILRAV